nr:AMP-binding protein [Rhodothermaceae bacterium]
NHYYSALGSNQNIPLVKGDRWLLSLPLYHVAGIAILFRSFIAGASIVIPNKSSSIDENLVVYEVTHASLVSTQLQRVLQHVDNEKYSHLKALLIGGSALSDAVRNKAFNEGLPVHFSYGLSEMSSQVTTTSSQPTEEEILTSGSLLSYRFVDTDHEGEIRVKGETLFLGYLENDSVRLPLDDEGWFHTGDLGVINEEGWLVVLGRKDNMFISGGENIYPEQIEKALGRYPGISRVMVVSVADKTFGRRPVAFIDVPDYTLFCSEIDQFLDGNLPRYMFPVRYFDWSIAPERKGIKDSRREFSLKAEQLIKEDR